MRTPEIGRTRALSRSRLVRALSASAIAFLLAVPDIAGAAAALAPNAPLKDVLLPSPGRGYRIAPKSSGLLNGALTQAQYQKALGRDGWSLDVPGFAAHARSWVRGRTDAVVIVAVRVPGVPAEDFVRRFREESKKEGSPPPFSIAGVPHGAGYLFPRGVPGTPIAMAVAGIARGNTFFTIVHQTSRSITNAEIARIARAQYARAPDAPVEEQEFKPNVEYPISRALTPILIVALGIVAIGSIYGAVRAARGPKPDLLAEARGVAAAEHPQAGPSVYTPPPVAASGAAGSEQHEARDDEYVFQRYRPEAAPQEEIYTPPDIYLTPSWRAQQQPAVPDQPRPQDAPTQPSPALRSDDEGDEDERRQLA